MEQSGHDTRSIGATAKPEQEQPVTRPVVVHNKGVRVANVILQPVAKDKTTGAGEHRSELARKARGRHRTDAGMVVDQLPGRILDQRIAEFNHVGAISCELIGRSVAADDDIFAQVLVPSPILLAIG